MGEIERAMESNNDGDMEWYIERYRDGDRKRHTHIIREIESDGWVCEIIIERGS